jgi:hypothetical protein
MSQPRLSSTIKNTSDTLRQGATQQITDYEQRFAALKNIYNELLADLILTGYNKKEADETGREFFGSTTTRFAGVDGTMYSRPMFDMVIFFGGAYASTGTITFSNDSEPKVSFDSKTLQQGMGISSVVPMYVNEILEVDHTFSAQEQPSEVNPEKVLTDEEIANNSLIANFMMTFSEYYLAYKLATDPDQNIRIILMDRSLSTDRASLLYETRKTDFWISKSTLIDFKLDETDIPLDKSDLAIARQHVLNEKLGLLPARADYLRHSIIGILEKAEKLTLKQIQSRFAVEDEKRTRRINATLVSLVQKQILTEKDSVFALETRYLTSWERIKKITIALGDRLFLSKSQDKQTANSMKILKKGKEHWLTTLDIAFLTLFSLQMLMDECWKKRILLIGVTKDTAARDFKRQLIPIMDSEGLVKTSLNREAFQELPNTDRMILQSASIFNLEKMKPPWSLIEYDSAFRTMVPEKQGRKGIVSGAIKNKISLERAFLKTYLQLSVAKSDPMLRSNVLLVDRLAHAEYDAQPEKTLRLWNELSDGTREPVDALLFKDKTVPNKLGNLAMSVLVTMAPSNIPEAFGHNKALFIADKIAKWNYSQFRCIVDTTATWILNNHKLRKFVFYMSTFRERRSQIEQTRRESV